VKPRVVTIIDELSTERFHKTEERFHREVTNSNRNQFSRSEIIEETKDTGYRMRNEEVKMLCHADDAVIMMQDEDNLQRLLHRFESMAEEYNMSISVRENRVTRDSQRTETLAVYNKGVDQIVTSRYLPANITNDRNLEEEMQMRAKQLWCLITRHSMEKQVYELKE
jgi:hypothetical protein